MKVEVHSAADFLMNLLRVKQAHSSLPELQLQRFNRSLQSLLVLRFRSHWYPDLPTRGSGYRCIRINGKMDPIVEQAGVAVGLPPPTLRKMLPTELTLWIDPEEVAYRIGENGSICVLYDSSSRTSPASDVGSSGSGGEEFVMERVGNKMLHPHPDAVAAVAAVATAVRYVAPRLNGDGIRTPSPPSSRANNSGASMRSPRLNNSVDNGSPMSPPISPQYHAGQHGQHGGQRHFRQQQQQHQQHHHQQQHQQQHHQQQQHLYGERAQNMFQWAGNSDSNDGYATHMAGKVRSQC